VRVGGVVEHQLGDHTQVAAVRLADERAELGACAVLRMDVVIVGDVVAIVTPGGGVEGQQPDGVDAEVLDVLELAREPDEIADAIVVGIEERPHVHLVDDRVFEPQRVAAGMLLASLVHARASRYSGISTSTASGGSCTRSD